MTTADAIGYVMYGLAAATPVATVAILVAHRRRRRRRLLDWAALFNVEQMPGESEASFRARVNAEIRRGRR